MALGLLIVFSALNMFVSMYTFREDKGLIVN